MDGSQATLATRPPASPAYLDPRLRDVSWPSESLTQALEVLASRAGLRNGSSAAHHDVRLPAVPPVETVAQAGRWIEWIAGHRGIEAEPVEFPLPELMNGLLRASPMIHAVQHGDELRFLVLLKAKGRSVVLIGPDQRRHKRPVSLIRDAAAAQFDHPSLPDLNRLLAIAQVPRGRRDRVRSAMLRERLAMHMVGGCWTLRLPATAPFLAQAAKGGLVRRLGAVITLLMAGYLIEISGWALIGNAALDGGLDLAWLMAWLLMLVSNLPVRLGAGWFGAVFTLDLGRLLKQRLLAGAFRTGIDEVRHQGVGHLLGRVMESQALETLTLTGGMTIITAALELIFAAWILAVGAGGSWHLLALLLWLAVMLAFSWRYGRRLRNWSTARLAMTHELIEHMVGHRTRLAQEWPHRRDEAEDRTMRDYLGTSGRVDKAITPVAAGAAGGWIILSLLVLAPAFITGSASLAGIAISLGGMLLANRAFAGLSTGIVALAQAGVAWTLVTDLFRAARAPAEASSAEPPTPAGGPGAERKVIEASDIAFRYQSDGKPTIQGLDLTIHQGDRILLEGESGGGKSTLSALLTGLRRPDSGLLLLDGLDRSTLGSTWHRLATEAPQFHENHILTGSLAFNLLMGRNWPPAREDLDAARALCLELGLGGLLDRMPAGLMQQVGETGWQLSHGERSRVFLARALLQDARLTILDESFAALDPETLKTCLNTAAAHARTLVVVAHP
jgi:ATP-binding cassette, subfamily B, bacterial